MPDTGLGSHGPRDRTKGLKMQIELSDEDAQLLREVLNSVVKDLSPEIANTDNASYRRDLVDRRQHIAAILEQVGGALP